ncbi:MAG: flagellar hook-associated protein FlgK [Paracoccaceae bacterium]
MSISSALSTALTGLTASSRMAEITASNVSNALTEGYARRELQLSARVVGQTGVGVTIKGVTRHINQSLLGDLRLSSAGQGYRATTSGFLTRIEKAMGSPDEAGSLSSRIAVLERSLIEAAARPESDSRLAAVLDSARNVTQTLSDLTNTIQTERQSADARIAADVRVVNDALAGVADLNIRIRSYKSAGRDTSALMDQRQQMIDRISEIVPVKEATRDFDQIALYTTGGTVLLDGRSAKLGFVATNTITPDMTIDSAALSGLTINGVAVTTHPNGGRIGEGRLSAQFNVRDQLAPSAQARIDALARDLIERVATSSVDPTLVPGDAGLFTDSGAAFDPLDEVGLAARIKLTNSVIPDHGGALWRLRDGLGAPSAGPDGYAGHLNALASAISDRRVQIAPGISSGSRSLAEFASDIVSYQSINRLSAEAEAAFTTARGDALRSELMRDGVDTDQEMQNLLLIEQAYAANAKVIQSVDEMINILLGM